MESSHFEDPALDAQAPIWTKRELFVFPDVMPGLYSLPMLLRHAEIGAVLFTDEAGNVLKFCEDQVHESVAHRLVWIGQHTQQWGAEINGEWVSTDWRAAVYVYSEIAPLEEREVQAIEAQPSRPEEVLVFADDFCGEENSPHPGWQRIFRPGEDVEKSSDYVWVGPRPESEADADNGNHQSRTIQQTRFEQALRIDPAIGRVALTRPIAALHGAAGCIRVRAWFFDTLSVAPQAHWLGVSCRHGSAAIGLAADFRNCYSFIGGSCPDGSIGAPDDWQPTPIARAHGWHFFEVLLDSSSLRLFIDGEAAANLPAAGASSEEALWLVARRGAVGHWAQLELMHTPRTLYQESPWARGEEEQGRWTSIAKERGKWQVRECGGQPVMLGETVQPEGIAAPIEAVPVESPPERPATASNALAIECWSVGHESELDRFERVVATFVEQLHAAGVIVPENFQRVGRCGARQDPQPCYIYRFGTRKLHMQVRETEGGRLCLVIRCGGGFLDFAEFARKNGGGEQLRLARFRSQALAPGRTVVQAASVLSNRKCQLRQASFSRSVRCNSTL